MSFKTEKYAVVDYLQNLMIKLIIIFPFISERKLMECLVHGFMRDTTNLRSFK